MNNKQATKKLIEMRTEIKNYLFFLDEFEGIKESERKKEILNARTEYEAINKAIDNTAKLVELNKRTDIKLSDILEKLAAAIPDYEDNYKKYDKLFDNITLLFLKETGKRKNKKITKIKRAYYLKGYEKGKNAALNEAKLWTAKHKMNFSPLQPGEGLEIRQGFEEVK